MLNRHMLGVSFSHAPCQIKARSSFIIEWLEEIADLVKFDLDRWLLINSRELEGISQIGCGCTGQYRSYYNPILREILDFVGPATWDVIRILILAAAANVHLHLNCRF